MEAAGSAPKKAKPGTGPTHPESEAAQPAEQRAESRAARAEEGSLRGERTLQCGRCATAVYTQTGAPEASPTGGSKPDVQDYS